MATKVYVGFKFQTDVQLLVNQTDIVVVDKKQKREAEEIQPSLVQQKKGALKYTVIQELKEQL